LRRFINWATLGKFNKAAFDHDIGAGKNTSFTRVENDKIFYEAMDKVVDAQKNFFKRNYLRGFKHFFIWAVMNNPDHYVGDEIDIKVDRALKPILGRLEEQRQSLDKDRKEVYEKAIELDKKRAELFHMYEKLQKLQKEIDSANKSA